MENTPHRYLHRSLRAFLKHSILCFGLVLACANIPSNAQETNGDENGELEERRITRASELSQIENAMAVSADTLNQLRRETKAIQSDAQALSSELVSAAARVQKLETQIQDTEAELDRLGEARQEARVKLNASRDVLSKVLASLQRLGKNPPPALIVSPNDALTAVRSAILMGAVLPEMRQEAEKLLANLEEIRALSDNYEKAKDQFTAQITNIKTENARIEILLEQKRTAENRLTDQIEQERRRAENLASRANSLNELIGALESEIDAARTAREQARLAEQKRQEELAAIERAEDRENAEKEQFLRDQADFKNPGRTEPAIAFSQAKGLLPRPVAGIEVKRFGEPSELLDQTQGIVISTRPNATIVTPADGWVLYAGQYRSFGQIVILNVGDNHNIVLAGLDQTNLAIGQFVISGEPIGRMGEIKLASAANLEIKSSRPALYVEFRKNGKPVDPTPWWDGTKTKREKNES